MNKLLSLALVFAIPMALLAEECPAKCAENKAPEFAETKAGVTASCQAQKTEETCAATAEASKEEGEKEYEFGWHDLAYGPLEILGGATAPLSMGCVGAYASITTAKNGLASYIMVPYAVPAAFIVNATYGTVVAPVLLLEGLCDTLTLGAWYPEHQAWNKERLSTYESRYDEVKAGCYPPEAKPVESK